MDRLFFIFAFAFCFFNTELACKKCDSNVWIEAKIDDEAITNLDVERTLDTLLFFSQINITPEDKEFLKRAILSSMIQEYIKYIYAKRQLSQYNNEFVSNKDVNDEFVALAASYGMTAKELIDILKSKGIDVSSIMSQIRRQLTWTAYNNAKYGNLVAPSESEAINYRKKLSKEYGKRAYRVERLFFPKISFSGSSEKTKKFASKIDTLLKAGIPFHSVSNLFSGLTVSNSSCDGDFISVGQLPIKQENEALKTMQQGSSKIIESELGVSIIRVSAIRKASSEVQKTVSWRNVIVPVDVNNTSELERQFVKLSEAVKNIKKAKDFISYARKLKYSISEKNESIESDLPNELKDIIKNIKPDGVSSPIVVPEGILIICVLEKGQFQLSIPSIDECKIKIANDKIDVCSEKEYKDAKKSVFVELTKHK